MSSIWKKPSSSIRQQELGWMNIMFSSHDQFCYCDDPWLHFLIILNKTCSAPKPEEEIKNIKWLITGEGNAIARSTEQDTEETGFFEGELERLFNEDAGEGTSTEENTR